MSTPSRPSPQQPQAQQPTKAAQIDLKKFVAIVDALAPPPKTAAGKFSIERDLSLLAELVKDADALTNDEATLLTAFINYLKRREYNDTFAWHRELLRFHANVAAKIDQAGLQDTLQLPVKTNVSYHTEFPLFWFVLGVMAGALGLLIVLLLWGDRIVMLLR